MNASKSDKWWYRLIQVVYVLFVAFSIFSVVASGAENIPTLNEYTSRYQLVCDNGSRLGFVTGSGLNNSQTDFSSDDNKKRSRFACSRTDLSGNELIRAYLEASLQEKPTYVPISDRVAQKDTSEVETLIPKAKNYQIELIEASYSGSWLATIIVWLFGLLIVVAVALVTRATFLYIAFKESFWRNLVIFKWKKFGK